MRIKNNTDATKRKSEITAADVEFALMLFVLIVVAFAAGYYLATAQMAAMLNN